LPRLIDLEVLGETHYRHWDFLVEFALVDFGERATYLRI
jgi:hypothetical protein